MPETSSVLVAPASSRRVAVPLAARLQPFALPRPDPLRVWEGSLHPSDITATTKICLRQESICNRAYLSIGVTSSSGAGLCGAPGGGAFRDYRGVVMQDLGNELPRIPIPRTRASYELGRKSHRNADSTVGLAPSRSTFPAFLSRF